MSACSTGRSSEGAGFRKVPRGFCLRESIRGRLEALASVFGIEVLTYAAMSNHLHLIPRNRPNVVAQRPDVVAQRPDEQVAIRWLWVFTGRRLEERLAEPLLHDVRTLANQPERLTLIRQRLSDITRFWLAAGKTGSTFRCSLRGTAGNFSAT